MSTSPVVEAVAELIAQAALAKSIEAAIDRQAGELAKLLVDRLRAACYTGDGHRAVRALKVELRDFNLTTNQWKAKP